MFVVVEGIDGSGKTTLVKALAERLGGPGGPFEQRVLVRHEPSRSDAGRAARAYFAALDSGAPYHPLVAAGLMIADRTAGLHARRHMVEGRDDLVLSDRGYLSTLVYQSTIDPLQPMPMGTTRWDHMRTLLQMHDGVPMPHLILVLDPPFYVAVERAIRRGEHLTEAQLTVAGSGYLEAVDFLRTERPDLGDRIVRIGMTVSTSVETLTTECADLILNHQGA